MSRRRQRWPDRFVWGVATAAHQIEGNNIGSDYWVLEHIPSTNFAAPSGDAYDIAKERGIWCASFN